MKQLEESLKEKNLRVTNARKIIFDILKNSERPLSPKNVCDELSNLSVSNADQASVYRNLVLFSKIGLAHKLDSGKYTVCQLENDRTKRHIHIIMCCTECMGVYELNEKKTQTYMLSKKIINSIKQLNHISSLTFSGVCEACDN